MNVTVTLKDDFQGAVYARGFPLECRALGSHSPSVTLQLAASGCGVRITPNSDGGLLYSVVLEVQMAKHLQQVTDPALPVTCVLTDAKTVLQSHAFDIEGPKSRTSRKMQDILVPHPKAWLEIRGSSDTQDRNNIEVGEYMTILVNTWLPEYIGGQVVNCWAHDGLGMTSQNLIDENGCPLDELLVPRLNESKNLTRSLPGYKFSVKTSSFPAFKFPDRESVHIRCGLQLCRGICEQVDCSSKADRAKHQRKYRGGEGEVLDYIQLFNSVKVLAPGIEIDNSQVPSQSYAYNSDEAINSFVKDAPFCMSTSQMALALASIGLIFMVAVAVSLYFLLQKRTLPRAQHQHSGSQDSLSLIIAQNSRSSISASAWSYGRI